MEARRIARRLVLRALHAATPPRRPRGLAALLGDGRAGAGLRVLVMRPDHLGDLLFATPALRLLKAMLPAAQVICLVGPWAAQVVAGSPWVDALVVRPFPYFDRRPKPAPWRPYAALLQLASELRSHSFDLSINLRFDFWWGAALAYLAGVPLRVGWGPASAPQGALEEESGLREALPFLNATLPFEEPCHEVERNLRLAEFAALRAGAQHLAAQAEGLAQEPIWKRHPLAVFPTREEEARAQRRLAEAGGRPVIAIHPGTGAPVKLWPTINFAAVGNALAKEFGARILLTGTKGEEQLIAATAGALGEEPLVCLDATLGELAALYRGCRLATGADSGALHLAVAAGTPTVHLYGPVEAARFGPWGDPGRHLVVRSRLRCEPCNRLDFAQEEIARHPCVHSIETDQVVEAARRLLHRAEAASGSEVVGGPAT